MTLPCRSSARRTGLVAQRDDEAKLEARTRPNCLDAAMRECRHDRVILTMLELEGRKVDEICRTLGISSVAVRVRAFRARGKLKGVLERLAKGDR